MKKILKYVFQANSICVFPPPRSVTLSSLVIPSFPLECVQDFRHSFYILTLLHLTFYSKISLVSFCSLIFKYILSCYVICFLCVFTNKKGHEYLKGVWDAVWPHIWHLCVHRKIQVTKCLMSKEMGQQLGPGPLLFPSSY